MPIERLDEEDLDRQKIAELEQKFADPGWRYGKRKEHEYVKEKKFPWGIVQLQYDLKDDIISDLEIYSDSMDTESIEELLEVLPGKRATDLQAAGEIQKDIIALLLEDET